MIEVQTTSRLTPPSRMIVSQYKCIFIHTPKCAGESIETVLAGKPYNRSGFRGHPEKHWGVHEISHKYPEEFIQYYKFSIVRNPWDRVVSWVKYRDMRYQRAEGTFEGRMQSDLCDKVFLNFMLEHSFSSMLFMGNRLAVDSVIRFENLEDEFPKICNYLGVRNKGLPHVNSTKHRHYSSYYTNSSRERVAELFCQDIQYFNYSFET